MDKDLRELERQARTGNAIAIERLQIAWKRTERKVKIIKTIDSRTFGVNVRLTVKMWRSICHKKGHPNNGHCKHSHKKKKAAISCAKRRAFRIFIEPVPLLWAEYVGLIDGSKPIDKGPLAFSKDGLLLSGQHRLQNFVRSWRLSHPGDTLL